MLGCHEFCGYYEWTFHFVRRKWGQEAVARLWAEAIGGESQRHYAEAAREAGLAGLYRTWVKTGEDEACDWTFTLDEARNVLRWDMRQCPSKGFLLTNDLNADEDYCDHCMGWMIPLLADVGVEVSEHEHNHLGQCWGTMRKTDRPSEPLKVKADVRDDPRWNRGYLDRWEHNRKQPLLPGVSSADDPCQLLVEWFSRCDRLVVTTEERQRCQEPLSAETSDVTANASPTKVPGTFVAGGAFVGGLMTDVAYVRSEDSDQHPLAVLIGHEDADFVALGKRYHESAPERRPLLVHAYLPGRPTPDLTSYKLPRPVPILPLLIRAGRYTHQPGGAAPSARSLLVGLANALGIEIVPSE